MKQHISLALLLFICVMSYGQELKCKEFKTGTFIIPATDVVPVSTLKRSETSQFESISKDDFMVLDIEWIDDCNYILKTNVEKTPAKRITDIDKAIDKNGGLRVEMLRTVNDTLFFRAKATFNGKEYPIDGYQIKVSDDY
ncbi:hypothetical protein [Psychroserpens luteolus]|uniref:hypothetical protein n=1 Tax=Psychroserpens luteolus TaxID=2855840 RepID=UPI001E46D2F4|nr:hypothetical protein [Psychroserpens luteolus]MCD2259380.1 hypothetical protein [Psychroserpens luteolus]